MLRAAGQSAAEPCRPALVVLDFDGTLTDAEAHAADFHEASACALAHCLGGDQAALRSERTRALEAVRALPASEPWTVNGFGVCPAAADPYLLANSVTRRLLARHRPDLDDRALVAAVLDVHHAAYASAPPPLKPDARDLLEALCGRGLHVRVVTNSRGDIVTALLDTLRLRRGERISVAGGADKFLVCGPAAADPRFESLPEVVDWPEVGRPVHLRRGRYFDVLRSIWAATRAAPGATLVAGDIFELDLAMPAALGVHVHLVTRASTLPHEVRLARRMRRGDAAAPLSAILERSAG